MPENLCEQLELATTGVLATTAFAFADVNQQGVLPPCDELIAASVAFQGPSAGRLTLAVSRELASTLARDMLGLDADEVTDENIGDALKELANIICGQWLTEVYGREPMFRLSVPVLSTTSIDSAEFILGESIALAVDDQPVLASVELLVKA